MSKIIYNVPNSKKLTSQKQDKILGYKMEESDNQFLEILVQGDTNESIIFKVKKTSVLHKIM